MARIVFGYSLCIAGIVADVPAFGDVVRGIPFVIFAFVLEPVKKIVALVHYNHRCKFVNVLLGTDNYCDCDCGCRRLLRRCYLG